MRKSVPELLISAGIELIGNNGSLVSLREIQRHAGIRNEAAIRYYFGQREDFIEACLADIAGRFRVVSDQEYALLMDRKSQRALKVTDIARALVKAHYLFLLQEKSSVWFMARMIREEGSLGQDLLIEYFGPMVWPLEEELRDILPEKPRSLLRFHFFLAINNTLNGMVDQGLLWRLPATGEHDRIHLSLDDFASGFIQYIAAGMSAINSDA